MGESQNAAVEEQRLTSELKLVRRLGWHVFRARDTPTVATCCKPPASGERLELPIQRRMLDVLDPPDATGTGLERAPLAKRDPDDQGLAARILFAEPGDLELPRVGLIRPRQLDLMGRYQAVANLRSVSLSTINKGPKDGEPRGGLAYQLLLDLVHHLGAAPSSAPDPSRLDAPMDALPADVEAEDEPQATADPAKQLGLWAQERYDEERFDEALPLFRALVALRQEALGPEHEMTQSALHSTIYTLTQLGRFGQALPLCDELLTIRRRTLGPDDQRTEDAKTWFDYVLRMDANESGV